MQSGRGDRQRGLWLRAILTVDPLMAGLDFQRLVLEYPGGAHSDEALLRLGFGTAEHQIATGLQRHCQRPEATFANKPYLGVNADYYNIPALFITTKAKIRSDRGKVAVDDTQHSR